MEQRFEVRLLEDAKMFLDGLSQKARTKVLYNIRKSAMLNDPELLKKLTDHIWEFRTEYAGIQYRLLAFWDEAKRTLKLVIATHGFVKKTDKVPQREIERASRLRDAYLKQSRS